MAEFFINVDSTTVVTSVSRGIFSSAHERLAIARTKQIDLKGAN